MLKLFYSPGACSLVTHIALEEAGAEFEPVRVVLAESQHLKPEYLAINPHARVPALATDRGVVTENIAILNLIADLFDAPGSVPRDDPIAAARCNELLGWFASSVHISFAQIWRGERFTDELQPAGPAIARQAGAEAFVVFDERIARHFSRWPNYISTAPGIAYAYVDDYRRARPDIFHQASTPAGLAADLRLPPERLAATLAQSGLNEPPYYAMGPIKPWLLLTPVGTAVNGKLQVLRDDGTPIDGLYAAGGAGQGGFTTTAHGHGLGWAMTSGRVAARHAAQAG